MRFGGLRAGDEPHPAALLHLGDGHGPGSQPVLPGMGDKHGGGELIQQLEEVFTLLGGGKSRVHISESRPFLRLDAWEAQAMSQIIRRVCAER